MYLYIHNIFLIYIYINIYILKYMEHLPCSRLILLATAASPACDHCPIISCDFSAGVQCVERFELPFFAPYLHHMTHMTWDIWGSVIVTYCHIWTTFGASTILNRDHRDPMPGFVDLLPRCVDRTPGDPCDSCIDCCVDCQYALAFSRFEQLSSLA